MVERSLAVYSGRREPEFVVLLVELLLLLEFESVVGS